MVDTKALEGNEKEWLNLGKRSFYRPDLGQNPDKFGQTGADSAVPFGQTGTDSAVPFGQTGADSAVPFGQTGTDSAVPFGQTGADSAVPFGQTGTDSANTFGQTGPTQMGHNFFVRTRILTIQAATDSY
jgi:nitrous oxide reductase accessory protein NosL